MHILYKITDTLINSCTLKYVLILIRNSPVIAIKFFSAMPSIVSVITSASPEKTDSSTPCTGPSLSPAIFHYRAVSLENHRGWRNKHRRNIQGVFTCPPRHCPPRGIIYRRRMTKHNLHRRLTRRKISDGVVHCAFHRKHCFSRIPSVCMFLRTRVCVSLSLYACVRSHLRFSCTTGIYAIRKGIYSYASQFRSPITDSRGVKSRW